MSAVGFTGLDDPGPSGQHERNSGAKEHQDSFVNLLQRQHAKRDGKQDAEDVFVLRLFLQQKRAQACDQHGDNGDMQRVV